MILKYIILFTVSFVFSLSPIIDSRLSLNVMAISDADIQGTIKSVRGQCNRINDDDDRREECLAETENSNLGEVGLGADEGSAYLNSGQITENTGDDLWWQIVLLIAKTILSTLGNLYFIIFQDGKAVPSAYLAVLSGIVFLIYYVNTEGTVGETLEKNIESLQNSVAQKLKFQFTGDMAKDTDTFNLMDTQRGILVDAAEMLQDVKEGVDAAFWIMSGAAVVATIEGAVCLFSGGSLEWCKAVGYQKNTVGGGTSEGGAEETEVTEGTEVAEGTEGVGEEQVSSEEGPMSLDSAEETPLESMEDSQNMSLPDSDSSVSPTPIEATQEDVDSILPEPVADPPNPDAYIIDKKDKDQFFVMNRVFDFISIFGKRAQADYEDYSTGQDGVLSDDDSIAWWQIVLRILAVLGIILKAFKIGGVVVNNVFYRPIMYGLEAYNLHAQSELINVEVNHFLTRAGILEKLIKKLESVFGERAGTGLANANEAPAGGGTPDQAQLESTEGSSRFSEEELAEIKRLTDKLDQTRPRFSVGEMGRFESMGADRFSEGMAALERMRSGEEADFDFSGEGESLAKKAEHATKQLLANLREEGNNVPKYEDIVKDIEKKQNENARKFLKDQNSKGLAGLKNLSMFSGLGSKQDLEKIQEESKQKMASIQPVKIPDFKSKKFDMSAFKLKPSKQIKKPKKKAKMIDFDSFQKKEINKFKVRGNDIFKNKNENIFRVISTRYKKSAYKYFFKKKAK